MLKVAKDFLADFVGRVRRSLGLLFRYMVSQIGIQAMNFVTGLLIIRSMAKDEYAAYTIMNTLVPVMLMLSDTGITNALMAIGRADPDNNEKMGRLVTTAMQLRRRFAVISFLVVGPLLAWMLFRNNVSAGYIVLLMAASLTSISFQLTGAIMNSVIGIRQQFDYLIRIGVASTLLRLLLIGGIVLICSRISAALALAAGTCSIVLETTMAVRIVRVQVLANAPADPEYRMTIYGLVKKMLPLTIYFCIQGQVSVWLISVFGSAHQVADLGAATRLALIYTTVSSSFAGIMTIKFARANGRRFLHLHFIRFLCVLFFILFAAVVFAYLVPDPFLWLLGPKYTDMRGLIWLVMLSAGFGHIAAAIFSLNTMKGWIPAAIITIPIEIVTQIVLLLCINVSTIQGVLTFSTLAAIPPGVVVTIMLLRRIRMEPEDPMAAPAPIT